MQIGIYTFADTAPDPATGATISSAERLRQVLEEIELADQGWPRRLWRVGEHHRALTTRPPPRPWSSPPAKRNARSGSAPFTSAVTVLSSDDPVRVFQDFATLDLISGGRAEIMAGRGSFVESFPLFGFDFADYDALFAEKLGLLAGDSRPRARDMVGEASAAAQRPRQSHPRPLQQPLPVWIAVGGTEHSVMRAATLGLPMALAIIGGAPERFAPLVTLYRETAKRAGHDPGQMPVSINSHTFVGATSQQAADDFYPSYAAVMTKIGRERGWPPVTRQQFDGLRSPRGALLVGSPQEVIDKIMFQHQLFGHQRFLAQLGVGAIPHDKVMRSIELLGTTVAPVIRRETAPRATSP